MEHRLPEKNQDDKRKHIIVARIGTGRGHFEAATEPRVSRLTSGVTLISGLAGVMAAIALQVSTIQDGHLFKRQDPEVLKIAEKLKATDARMTSLSAQLSAKPEDLKVAVAMEAIREDVKQIKDRLAGFEIALGDDPTKKLAIPMLRKDFDNLRDSYRYEMAALREESERFVGLMKWLLAAVGGSNLVVGLLNFFPRRSPPAAGLESKQLTKVGS